ncbi:MAG TPA: 30S ribosomal protein S20 [Burkholderiales bacterium]|jgi:small subunit ribosomal protein S20|nr:30S ribosomal protein S20 [Burkholderiales bacterium]
MANIASAKKRAKQAEFRRRHNSGLHSTLRSAVKNVRKAIASGNKAAAQAAFRESVGIIDSVADKRIVHKNQAARHKSRLSQAVKAMA